MEALARIGLISRGMVYFLIGGLALLMAVGDSHGKATDTKGAMRNLLEQPFGTFLLSVIALGLFCYAIWRAIQAITDSDHLGSDFKGYCIRSGRMAGAVFHVVLGAYAFALMFLLTSTRGPRTETLLARFLLKLPMGDWLLGGVGAGILIFAIAQFVIAWREQFCDYISIPVRGGRTLKSICKFGLVARGFVFLIIGSFFIQAALKRSSREAGGLKEAWETLRTQPYGHALVGIVALGLIAYAFFTGVEATYRKQT